jgi:ureidoacrylate peracid hydrolase
MVSPSSPVEVQARPTTITLDPSQTAVIVVDMQNDFASVGGVLHRLGNDVSLIRNVIGPISRVLSAAREAGMKVVYLKMEYRPDLSEVGAPESKSWELNRFSGVGEAATGPDGQEGRILIQDTWNTDIVGELAPHAGDIVVAKRRFSGFYGTDLDVILRGLGIKNLVFTGCTTSVCVESTLRDAMFRDYRCLLLADCTAEPIGHGLARSNHEATLLLVEIGFGWVTESAELVRALVPRAHPVTA